MIDNVKRLADACRGIISLSDPSDFVSNGEWRRAVADLEAALAPYRASASRSSSGSGDREALALIGDLVQALIDAEEDGFYLTTHSDLIARARALSSGSPSPATGDET